MIQPSWQHQHDHSRRFGFHHHVRLVLLSTKSQHEALSIIVAAPLRIGHLPANSASTMRSLGRLTGTANPLSPKTLPPLLLARRASAAMQNDDTFSDLFFVSHRHQLFQFLDSSRQMPHCSAPSLCVSMSDLMADFVCSGSSRQSRTICAKSGHSCTICAKQDAKTFSGDFVSVLYGAFCGFRASDFESEGCRFESCRARL